MIKTKITLVSEPPDKFHDVWEVLVEPDGYQPSLLYIVLSKGAKPNEVALRKVSAVSLGATTLILKLSNKGFVTYKPHGEKV